jgi:hypothetical protein
MDFKENLESVFGRKVNLLKEQTLKNPILINSINQTKELIFMLDLFPIMFLNKTLTN